MMALSIGSLIGYLELNDDKLQATADRADKTLSGLDLQLQALEKDHGISLETTAAQAKIDDLRKTFTQLRADSAEGSDVRVDTVSAMTKLAALKSEIRSVARDAETPKDLDVSTAAALTKIAILRERIKGAKKAWEESGKGPSWLTVGIFGLGPMLLPMLTSAVGLMGALGVTAVAAAAGIGVLKVAFDGVGSSISAYETYQTAMKAATTASQRQAAEYAFKTSAYSTGSPQTQAFTRMYVDRVRPALQKTQQTAQKAVLPGVTAGIGAALPVLTAVDGAVAKLGKSLGSMADEAGHALNSPFWKQWFTWLGNDGAKDLQLIGAIGGNFLTGIATSLERFAPVGTSFLQWLDDLSKRFATWTAGTGFTGFMASVQRSSAAVIGFFRSAGPLVKGLLEGFNASGIAELKAFSVLFQGIAHLPTGVLKVIGELLPPIILGLKAWEIGTKLVTAATKALEIAQAALDVVLDANPVSIIVVALAALAVGFAYAWKHSQTFRDVVGTVMKGTVSAVTTAVAWILRALGDMVGWLHKSWKQSLDSAAQNVLDFKNRVNADIDGITGQKTITITPRIAGVSAPGLLNNLPAIHNRSIERRKEPIHVHVHVGGKEVRTYIAGVARESAANDRAYGR